MSKEIKWQSVERVLVVRLRSIGDTVLSTPALIALRRFLPEAQIDILLEDWVAPVLEGSDAVDNVLSVSKKMASRLRMARRIRRTKYDLALNLHGGPTATFFVRATGARHRVGFANYQFSLLHNHRLTSASAFWHKEQTHSAEQQLALVGFLGIPVEDRPRTRLAVTEQSLESLNEKLKRHEDQVAGRHAENPNSEIQNPKSKIAMLHPTAAFKTKQWATEGFAHAAEFLAEKGFRVIAVAAENESAILDDLKNLSRAPILALEGLTLPEITALASRAEIFVGNDSGIAHIAAAVLTPSVVIFGSSNRNHWRPWTDAPHEIVFVEFPCQPCAGYICKEFGEPKCILSVKTESVTSAIERVLVDNPGSERLK